MGVLKSSLCLFGCVFSLCCFGGPLGVFAAPIPISQHFFVHHRANTFVGAFSAFKDKYNKVYSSTEEEAVRFTIFKENLVFIARHNLEYTHGKHSFTVGLNEFADLSWREFAATYLQPKTRQPASASTPSTAATQPILKLLPNVDEATIPAHDWRTHPRIVSPVAHQGPAPTGWAFAATAALEAARTLTNGAMGLLATQQLLDCQGSTLTSHSPATALAFVSAHGIAAQADYEEKVVSLMNDASLTPASRCNKSWQTAPVMAAVGDVRAVHASEQQLRAAVTQQPISVVLVVPSRAMQFYHSGVFSSSCTLPRHTNVHTQAMLLVGYGLANSNNNNNNNNNKEAAQSYWILKNSWGESWGDRGYLLLAREQVKVDGGAATHVNPGMETSDGLCGVHRTAVYPTIPGPHYQRPIINAKTSNFESRPSECLGDESELVVSFNGSEGSICAPHCSPSHTTCPLDLPSGTTATPQCLLDATGALSSHPTYCALVCDSTSVCPLGSSCVSMGAISVCLFL